MCGRKRRTARRENALPKVIQEDNNENRKVTTHEADLNAEGPKLPARQVHGSY